MIKHKSGVENKFVDALSRRMTIFVAVSMEVIEFERLKDDYETCLDFGDIYTVLRDGLFLANKLITSSKMDFSLEQTNCVSPRSQCDIS